MRCSFSGQAEIPKPVVPVNRLHGEGEDQQQLSGLPPAVWDKEPDVCLFWEQALLRFSTVNDCLCGKAEIPISVVPVNRLHGAGEDQQQLSGLLPSVWDKEPDVCLFGNRLCRGCAP